MENMRNKLMELKENSDNKMYQEVIDIALSHIDEYENPTSYFEEVLYGGCQSGVVVEMIMYRDTHDFFDRNYNFIFDLYNQYVEEGILFNFELSKNNLSWFGYEETLRQIAYDLDLEF